MHQINTHQSKLYLPHLILAIAAFITVVSTHTARADVDDTAEPEPTETTRTCTTGQVWDADKKTCIDIKDSRFDDETVYQQARELAYADRYQDAIALLNKAADSNNPKILNYLGFSYRKAGDMDKAMNYYQQALTINPDYILARSYMGQGLVTQGKLELAIDQLEAIAQRGGQHTRAYQTLAMAIETQSSDY